MANFQNLKNSIAEVIKTNGNNEITGKVLKDALLTMISNLGANYQFAGIATPATNPGTPDGKVFYIASTNGLYPNFGGANIQDEVCILKFDNSWVKIETGILSVDGVKNKQDKLTFDTTPTEGSNNPVTSGGIKKVIDSQKIDIEKNKQDIINLTESKQNNLTFDSKPTDGSNNPVTSNGIKMALDSQKSEVDAAKDSALSAISDSESNAIANFNAQRVTPEMLSESTKQLIEAAGGGTINNLPDDEDLTSKNIDGSQVLKFNDKKYNKTNFSGLGRKYLRKNIQDGKNILTQDMLSDENTIYIIQYDYDLNGGEINIPNNCILQFNGGTLKNGTINIINEYNSKLLGYEFLYDDVIVNNVSVIYIDWFKTYKITLNEYKEYKAKINLDTASSTTMDGIPDTNNNILNNNKINSKIIVFGKGLYVFSNEINNANFIIGYSREKTLLFFPNSAGLVNSDAGYSFIKNMAIISKNDSITFTGTHHGQRCEELYVTSYTGDAFVDKGLVYGGIFRNIDACAGNDRYMFNNFGSNSNVFDRVIDPGKDLIDSNYPVNIGTMNAFFLNGGSQSYRNANILYYGAKYFLRYGDENTPAANMRIFRCENCTFENNAKGFENIVYCNDTQCANMSFIFSNIMFISGNYKNKMHFYCPQMVNLSINCNANLNVYSKTQCGNLGLSIIKNIYTVVDNERYGIGILYPLSGLSVGNAPRGNVNIEVNDANKNLFDVTEDFIPDEWKNLTFSAFSIRTMPSILSCLGTKDWAVNQAFGNIAYDNDHNEFSIGNVSGNAKLILAIDRDKIKIIKTLDELKWVRSLNFAGAYIIANNIDLNGETINFNADANVIFMGGSLNNGIINGSNSLLGFRGTATCNYYHNKGPFSQKPTKNLIEGQSYFCTDKQTSEGATNGIMIYYKGDNVWVDALGRVVE